MIFFIIAAAVMTMLIVSIHKLAGHFGCELPLSSLVLCGVCAIVINFVIISVTPFLTNSYYYTAGAMILFAAFGTTCYNKYLLHRKIHLAGGGTLSPVEADEITEAATEAALCASPGQEATVTAGQISDICEEAEASTDVIHEETEVDEAADDVLEEVEAAKAADDVHEKVEVDKAADDVLEEAEVDKAADDVHEEVEVAKAADDVHEKAEVAKAADDVHEEAEVDKAADDVHEEVEVTGGADDTCDKTEAEAETAEEAEPDSGLEDILSSMTTMDQLLDFAFEQGMQKQHQVALAAYQAALERYRGDSYAPFIVVSIANIHKELGNYDAAIDSIRSAMDIPAMLENSSIRQQFEDTMSYLVITRSVLQTAGLSTISFKEIPKEYMSKIESIYNSRKSR